MKVKLFVIFLFVVVFLNANAQEFKLGKVSEKELEEKINHLEYELIEMKSNPSTIPKGNVFSWIS